MRTHDLHCVRSHCVFKHIDIHLERLLNETGQSRSRSRSRSPGNGQWAKIVGPKYAGKCSNFQLASTHTNRHSYTCIRVCLMKSLKLSTANRVGTLSLSLSLLAYPGSANWRNWVYQFKTDHKLECKKK